MAKLSVSEILASRDRGRGMSTITDAITGKKLTEAEAKARMPAGGYKVNLLGSAGYGNGGGGHHGGNYQEPRKPIHGYSFAQQGGADDYVRKNGGISPPRKSLLNDLYLNQPGKTMGAFDKLQSQKAMDQSDPASAFFVDQAAQAQSQGLHDQADFFRSMLEDQLAQQQAAKAGTAAATGAVTGGAGVQDGYQSYHSPGEKRSDAAGNVWQWNEAAKHGEMITPAAPPPTFMDTYNAQKATMSPPPVWDPTDNLGEGTLHTQYGDASVSQAAPGGPSQATFTNQQGSGLGGVNFPGQQGTQNAEEFFQGAANRQGPNKFAVPSPGYAGTPSNAWGAYSRAMAAKKSLGKA